MTDKAFEIGDYALRRLSAELADGFGNTVVLTTDFEGAGSFIRLTGSTDLLDAVGAALDPEHISGLAVLAQRLCALADEVNAE